MRVIAGGPLNFAGLGVGGGCGVGLGLGWGYGGAYGAKYIIVNPEFSKVKPAWKQKLDDFASNIPVPFPGKPSKDVQQD